MDDDIPYGTPIPECIIKKEDFDTSFITDFRYELIWGWCCHSCNNKYSYRDLYSLLMVDLCTSYNNSEGYFSFREYVINELKHKDLDEVLLKYCDICENKNAKSSNNKSLLRRFRQNRRN